MKRSRIAGLPAALVSRLGALRPARLRALLQDRQWRFSIRAKLMGIITSGVLLSLGLLTFFSLNLFEEDITNMLLEVNSRTSKLLAEKIGMELEKRIEHLRLADILQRRFPGRGADPLVETFYDRKDETLYTAVLARRPGTDRPLVETPLYEIIRPGALKQAGIGPGEIRRRLAELHEPLARALRGEVVVRNVSPLFGKAVWMAAVPLPDANRPERVGVFLSPGEPLVALFSSDRIGRIDSVYSSFLVDDNGRLVVHPEKSRMIGDSDLSSHPAVKRMLESPSKSGVLLRYPIGERHEIGAYTRIETGNLGILTVVEEDRGLEGVYIARARALIISLIIICAFVLFIYYFSKTLTEPIKDLVRATRSIGDGYFHQQLESRTRDELDELIKAFNLMGKGLEEREKLKGAFGKFVNPEIARRVLAGELRLGGERKEVAVFFSDIRSFTAISETLEPEEVVEFLNEYMTLMVDIIRRKHGVVDKFIGDAIMAVWGAPVSRGNDVENCIDAALLMRKALVAFNERRRKQKKPPIVIGCGINFGPVLAGQIGSEDRLEYTVIGDTVNLASRIETLNKPFATDILISEAAHKRVEKTYLCTAMDKILVKGKAKAQQVYAVLGRRDDPHCPRTLAQVRRIAGITTPAKTGRAGEEKKYAFIKK